LDFRARSTEEQIKDLVAALLTPASPRQNCGFSGGGGGGWGGGGWRGGGLGTKQPTLAAPPQPRREFIRLVALADAGGASRRPARASRRRRDALTRCAVGTTSRLLATSRTSTPSCCRFHLREPSINIGNGKTAPHLVANAFLNTSKSKRQADRTPSPLDFESAGRAARRDPAATPTCQQRVICCCGFFWLVLWCLEAPFESFDDRQDAGGEKAATDGRGGGCVFFAGFFVLPGAPNTVFDWCSCCLFSLGPLFHSSFLDPGGSHMSAPPPHNPTNYQSHPPPPPRGWWGVGGHPPTHHTGRRSRKKKRLGSTC